MRGVCRAHDPPAAIQNRRLCLSPIDALIYLVVGSGLFRQIPIRLDLPALAHLRITAIPQQWPARGGYARGLRVGPDVLQYLHDLCALGNERDQPDLPTAHRTEQREHLVDAGDQQRPQVVRLRLLGLDGAALLH
jgi:hypothetical protein